MSEDPFERQRANPQEQTFPEGKIHPDDEGELSMRLAVDFERDLVVIEFAKPAVWLALGPEEAMLLAGMIHGKAILLLEKAREK